MRTGARIAILAALALAVAATVALRERGGADDAADRPPAAAPAPPASAGETAAPPGPVVPAGTPRLLELGSNRCLSCQEMAKVLDALRASQGARLQVDFIDIYEQPDAIDRYGMKLMPTQILFDGEGREIYRHTGYFPHDDILAKYRELGVGL